MLQLWSAAVYNPADDLDYNLNPVDRQKEDERDRKRQRRSIFFAQPDSDSDDEDDYGDPCQHRSLNPSGRRTDISQITTAVIPATPYVADPLSKGTCLLSPSFPRRSPCLGATNGFVAVHEEPNAGFRHYMEDRSAAMTADGVAYLGIYDGHGGVDASTFLQRHLLPTIQAHLHPGCDVHDALTTAYMATNAAFRATGSIQGSTATTVILKNRHLIAANVGDSPAFVVKKTGEVYSIIQEHKIEGEEAARIAAQGVPIYRSPTGPAYMGTPDGTRWLNMSRAFGDFVYPAISCEPHVCSLDVTDGKYLVMGSDGLTEKWPVAEAAQYLTQLANDGWSLPAICRSLVEHSLARGSTDNISCMIVDLEAYMQHADAMALSERRVPADGVCQPPELGSGEDGLTGSDDRNATGQQVRLHSGRESCAQQQLEEGEDGPDGLGALQGLLCEEDTAGEEPMLVAATATAGWSRPPVATVATAMLVSAAALASCAEKCRPDCSRVDADSAEQPCPDGPALEREEGAAASPTCSSPDACDKQHLGDCEAPEGDRQATPQPMQTACRLLTPVNVDPARDTWSDGSGGGDPGAA